MHAHCKAYSRPPSWYYGLESLEDRALAWVVDRTCFTQAAVWQEEEEDRIRAADPDIPPRPKSVDQIREARMRQGRAFEDMEKIMKGGNA